jgi:hypothetical protein
MWATEQTVMLVICIWEMCFESQLGHQPRFVMVFLSSAWQMPQILLLLSTSFKFIIHWSSDHYRYTAYNLGQIEEISDCVKQFYFVNLWATCSIINKLKCSKPPGSDNISPELIKNWWRSLKEKLHKLILNVWETGKLPAQWTKGIICPIHKKGDRLNCHTYRPITLLNIVYKIFAILLNNRLTDIT